MCDQMKREYVSILRVMSYLLNTSFLNQCSTMCEHCPHRVTRSLSSEYRGLTVLEYTLCLLNNNYNIVPQAVSSDDRNKLYAFNYSLKLIYMIAMSQRLKRSFKNHTCLICNSFQLACSHNTQTLEFFSYILINMTIITPSPNNYKDVIIKSITSYTHAYMYIYNVA